jgi:mitogen-activated protein kinase kinase
MLQRELLTLQKCCSPYILQYFGAIVSEFQVSLILEYMDRGSLSDILRQTGPLPEPILGKIALNVSGFARASLTRSRS